MSVVSTALALQTLKDENVSWRLLRTTRAPLTIAILDSHFTEDVRRIAVPEFVNAVQIDLDEITFRTSLEVNLSAAAYCEKWRADGFLIRRPMTQSRQETYELSSGALMAIDYAKRLVQPHRTATQSRLGTIIDQISALALDADENEARRRQALIEERARIDRQLALLDQGEMPPLDEAKALERASDIVSLAREIPTDFVHVRNDFEQIDHSLYETIINYEPGHKELLESIFDGVDEISQSASGQSFKGFYSLLRDSDLVESLQDDIDTVLDSSFANGLSPDERRFLRNLMRTFTDQSQEVNGVMTSFAHGLRRFVQTQNYQQERVLKQRIDQALGQAHRLVERLPCTLPLSNPLDLTSTAIMPVSRWKLKNPIESIAAPVAQASAAPATTISLEELRAIARETEIDFAELTAHVNDCLDAAWSAGATAPSDSVSIADVLRAHPATQGLASIVGLVALALENGHAQDGSETLHWKDGNGRPFKADVPLFTFTSKVAS